MSIHLAAESGAQSGAKAADERKPDPEARPSGGASDNKFGRTPGCRMIMKANGIPFNVTSFHQKDDSPQNLFRQALERPESEYRVKAAESARREAAGAALKSAPGTVEMLQEVNDYWNRYAYKTDEQNYGVNDYWASPEEMAARKAGDCEDFVIAKYKTLTDAGWKKDKAWLMIVQNPKAFGGNDDAHAVLIAETDKGDAYVLDNRAMGGKKLYPFNGEVSFNGARRLLVDGDRVFACVLKHRDGRPEQTVASARKAARFMPAARRRHAPLLQNTSFQERKAGRLKPAAGEEASLQESYARLFGELFSGLGGRGASEKQEPEPAPEAPGL